ncbi:MAG: D-cysteine desulfhydrase family protein [Pseudomonadota bacterium]
MKPVDLSPMEKYAPRRLDLARTPTPLEPLSRWGKKLGVRLLVKRDDLTGIELSGNKVRKLEFVMAEAMAQGADTVITCGGAQSNHSRATAMAAARLGLKSRLILRTPDPLNPPPLEGNSLLDRLVGAEIVWISPEQYGRRGEIFEREAELLRKEGHRPYLIPEGASDALGAWGYIRAVGELAQDLAALESDDDSPWTLVHAAGSGGTAAGLILGVKHLGLNARVASVNVCDDRDYFARVIGGICETAIDRFGLNIEFSREKDIDIIDGYVGRGYALSSPPELELIRDVARAEGIVLDPVYTGKAFFGLTRELAAGRKSLGRKIVFFHTGGIFGLFSKSEELSALL